MSVDAYWLAQNGKMNNMNTHRSKNTNSNKAGLYSQENICISYSKYWLWYMLTGVELSDEAMAYAEWLLVNAS